MPDDIKIPVTTPGARQAKQALRGVADAEKQIGQAGKQGGREAAEGLDRAERGAGRLMSKIKSLVASFAGMALVRRILSGLAEETERMDRASLRAAESMRSILALSTLGKERPEVQRALYEMAVSAGRPIEQIAPAYYTLLGGTAGMAPERRTALFQQAILMGKTDPAASLNALVNLFTTIGTQQPQLAPVQIGNLLSQAIEQAKSTPAEMAAYLPAILTTARVGGVDLATAAAMFTFGTRRGGGVAESGTAVRAAMLGLLAPTPDTAKALGEYGFPAEGGLMARLGWLAQRGGQLPPELVAGLGGRRGLEAIAGIAEAPEAFGAEAGLMRRGLAGRASLLQQRLAAMYGEVPGQALAEAIRQLQVARELEDVRVENLARQYVEEKFRTELRQEGRSWVTRQFFELMMALGRGTGVTEYGGWQGLPREQAQQVAERAAAELRERGSVVNFQGGTHYHGQYTDPAGEAVAPMGP